MWADDQYEYASEMTGADPKETSAFYDWQDDHGVSDRFAENTNRATVAAMLAGKVHSGHEILDLGCGSGLVASELASRGFAWSRYVGLDLSPKYVARFRGREIASTFPIEADARDLRPYADRSFDIVMGLFLLQDLAPEESRPVIRSIVRVLRPGGFVVLSLRVDPGSSRELGNAYRPKALAAEGIPSKYAYVWGIGDFENLLRSEGLTSSIESRAPAANGMIDVYGIWTVSPAAMA